MESGWRPCLSRLRGLEHPERRGTRGKRARSIRRTFHPARWSARAQVDPAGPPSTMSASHAIMASPWTVVQLCSSPDRRSLDRRGRSRLRLVCSSSRVARPSYHNGHERKSVGVPQRQDWTEW